MPEDEEVRENPAGTAPSAARGGRETEAEAAARLYLDLWERNLVHVALKGPLPVRSGR